MKVSIGIITCKRPDGLARLLCSLNKLEFKKISEPEIEIIVVDNDPVGEAERVCIDFMESSKWLLSYHSEPRRGIPFARNKVIDVVSEGTNFVAFIDDDEEALECWLEELLIVQIHKRADVVTGPVLSHFPDNVPDWAIKGRFYDRESHLDGELIDYARTGNVLIAVKAFQVIDLKFNEEMALTGGTDTLFFEMLMKNGCSIAWADNAIVKEWVPRSRICVKWVLQRAYRTANTDVLFDMVNSNEFNARFKSFLNGVGRIVIGIFILPVFLFAGSLFGKHLIVKSLRIICRGAGMLSGAFGLYYQEYKKIHSC